MLIRQIANDVPALLFPLWSGWLRATGHGHFFAGEEQLLSPVGEAFHHWVAYRG